MVVAVTLSPSLLYSQLVIYVFSNKYAAVFLHNYILKSSGTAAAADAVCAVLEMLMTLSQLL